MVVKFLFGGFFFLFFFFFFFVFNGENTAIIIETAITSVAQPCFSATIILTLKMIDEGISSIYCVNDAIKCNFNGNECVCLNSVVCFFVCSDC